MRAAVLIITQHSARQLKRVVSKLSNGFFDIYIHINKRTDPAYYSEVLALPDVYLVADRVNVRQGGYSKLQATINGVRQILDSGADHISITLMSGREYPIKSADHIRDTLYQNRGKQFIGLEKHWYLTNKEYIDRYHLIDRDHIAKKMLVMFMNTFFRKPAIPANLKVVGGSAYWTLTPSCARYVVEYIERYQFGNFLKYTKNCDRFIFQSIIMNSSYRTEVVENDLRYADQPDGRAHPKTLITKDLDKILATDALFGRILDLDIDRDIFDLIDNANDLNERTPA